MFKNLALSIVFLGLTSACSHGHHGHHKTGHNKPCAVDKDGKKKCASKATAEKDCCKVKKENKAS